MGKFLIFFIIISKIDALIKENAALKIPCVYSIDLFLCVWVGGGHVSDMLPRNNAAYIP